MLRYDTVEKFDLIFYLVLKKNSLKYCSTDKEVIKNAIYNKEHLLPYTSWLRNYFNGSNQPHKLNLIFDKTAFINSVHEALVNIPYGELSTYKDIAHLINNPKGFRAVGNAIGKNDLLIFIPCHRVIKSDGSLGGFSSGLKLKQDLINLEQANKK